MSSRSRAARSYSWLAAATCISLLEPAQVRRGLAGHEVAEVLDDRAVLLGADPADARRRALADVAEQARPADLPRALEHPGRAGPGREDPQQQVEGLADRPGVRVGPEVADALLLRPAHHLQPGELLVQRHRQAGVALVVAVLDVEARVELLDPAVLQLQRLDLGLDDGPLDAGRRGDHRLGARVQVGDVLEVRRQPRPEAVGLADVDDPAALVAEPVDARVVRDRARRGTVRRRICHSPTLRRPGVSRRPGTGRTQASTTSPPSTVTETSRSARVAGPFFTEPSAAL